MAKRRLIHRFDLEPDGHGETVARLPAGARVLYVNPFAAELWAEVPEVPLRGIPIDVRVAHTGQPAPAGEHVGTFIVDTGPVRGFSRFVGHVYVGGA